VEQVDTLELLQHYSAGFPAAQPAADRGEEGSTRIASGDLRSERSNPAGLFEFDPEFTGCMSTGGELRIAARALDGGVEITFHDTGPGIPRAAAMTSLNLSSAQRKAARVLG